MVRILWSNVFFVLGDSEINLNLDYYSVKYWFLVFKQLSKGYNALFVRGEGFGLL